MSELPFYIGFELRFYNGDRLDGVWHEMFNTEKEAEICAKQVTNVHGFKHLTWEVRRVQG